MTAATKIRHPRSIHRSVFPGSRAVWLGGFALSLIALVFTARLALAHVGTLTGTNSVAVATIVGTANSQQRACIKDLVIPQGTASVAISMVALRAGPAPGVTAWIQDGPSRVGLRPRTAVGSLAFVPFSPTKPIKRDLSAARVCVVGQGLQLAFGGAAVQRLPRSPATTIAGKPLVASDIAIRYGRPDGRAVSLISSLGAAITRAASFTPGPSQVLLWLALPAFVLILYIALRIAAVAHRYSIRRLALLAGAVAFVYAGLWAILLHPFHGADESEHFAYAQYLATTNHRPDRDVSSDRLAYSSSQLRLMEALHHNSTILNTTSRPRWDELWADRYQAASRGASESDGGGGSESATGHSPFYYAIVGLPYRVFGGPQTLPENLLIMRLFNALFAALVASLAVLTAGLAFGGQARVSWAAGLLAGLQPVFGTVAASVNNDTAVNVLAACLIYLLVRSYVVAPSDKRAILVGATAVLLPVAKVTGFALLPMVIVVAALLACRYGVRRAGRWSLIVVASTLVVFAMWSFVVSPAIGAGRGSLLNVHQSGALADTGPTAAVDLPTRVEYFEQTFLPWPTIGADHWKLPGPGVLERWPAYFVYIDRGYGLYGWKSVRPGNLLLIGVFAALTAGWLAVLIAAWRHRAKWRLWLGPATILVGSLLSVLAFVSYAYATTGVRFDAGEQGRYVFPALVPLSVMFAGSMFAVRRGMLQQIGAGLLVSAAAWLAAFAWLTALRGWYL